MYDVEIREARRIIDDTAKDRAAAELRAKRAEEETTKFRDKYIAIFDIIQLIFTSFVSVDMIHY
jgi:hypothetical protein